MAQTHWFMVNVSVFICATLNSIRLVITKWYEPVFLFTLMKSWWISCHAAVHNPQFTDYFALYNYDPNDPSLIASRDYIAKEVIDAYVVDLRPVSVSDLHHCFTTSKVPQQARIYLPFINSCRPIENTWTRAFKKVLIRSIGTATTRISHTRRLFPIPVLPRAAIGPSLRTHGQCFTSMTWGSTENGTRLKSVSSWWCHPHDWCHHLTHNPAVYLVCPLTV